MCAWLGATALVAAANAGAQTLPGDPGIGRDLAEEICAECHLIEPGEIELYAEDPPSFQTIADDQMVTEISIRVFFQTPHRDMPDLMLADDDIDHIAAYLLSLRDGR